MWDINKGHLLFSPRFREWVIFKSGGLNHFTNWNAYDVKYAFETIVFLTWDLLETSQIHIFLPCTFKYSNVSSQYAHHIVLYRTLLGVDISLPLDTWLIIFFMAIAIFVYYWAQFITYYFRSDTSCNPCWWRQPYPGIFCWFLPIISLQEK